MKETVSFGWRCRVRGLQRPSRPLQRRLGRLVVVATALRLMASFAAGVPTLQDDDLENWEYIRPSSPFRFRAERFDVNPIIHREMQGLEGDAGLNINGPSLIRVPEWIEKPLGKYYLYFAHHHGSYIRLAYADALEGPWRIYAPGVLHMKDTPAYEGRRSDHVASPDVHLDQEQNKILMYYHSLNPSGGPRGQGTYLAISNDGLNFRSQEEHMGHFYFRVFQHAGWHYALAKYHNNGGILYRSRDARSGFETGLRILPRVRHMAVWKHREHLYVFFSRGQDSPEHILVSRIENLHEPWHDWKFTEPQSVLLPERDYEGVSQPIQASRFGSVLEFVHQLRDPAVFEEDGRLFLLYSAAGEWSIAISELHLEEGE